MKYAILSLHLLIHYCLKIGVGKVDKRHPCHHSISRRTFLPITNESQFGRTGLPGITPACEIKKGAKINPAPGLGLDGKNDSVTGTHIYICHHLGHDGRVVTPGDDCLSIAVHASTQIFSETGL